MNCSPQTPQIRQRRRVQIIDLIKKVNNFYIMKSIQVASFVVSWTYKTFLDHPTDLWDTPYKSPDFGRLR